MVTGLANAAIRNATPTNPKSSILDHSCSSDVWAPGPVTSCLEQSLKVPITPKYFFRLNKSLHLFGTCCAFLSLFNPNIYLLQAVKSRNMAIICHTTEQVRGMGLFLVWRHKLLCIHVYKDLIWCKSISLWHQIRNRPMPLTSSVMWQTMARFRNFYNIKKSQDLV